MQIETQRDLIGLQNGILADKNDTIKGLMSIMATNLNPHNLITTNVTVTTKVELNQDISLALASIGEIKELLQPSSKAFVELQNIEIALDAIEKEKDPNTIKKSSALRKFKGFIDKVTEGNNEIKKAIQTTKDGWDIFKQLAGKYNSIAEWCGLPQVPKMFTK